MSDNYALFAVEYIVGRIEAHQIANLHHRYTIARLGAAVKMYLVKRSLSALPLIAPGVFAFATMLVVANTLSIPGVHKITIPQLPAGKFSHYLSNQV